MNILLLSRVVFIALAAVPAMVMAQTPILAGFTPGTGPSGSFYGTAGGDVVGYQFTADMNMSLSHLGILIDPGDGVLDSSHDVGLWDAAGTLLAQASVSASGLIVGDFVYAEISPVAVVMGDRYTLGALYAESDSDSYWSAPASVSLNGISNTTAVFPASQDLGFVLPTGVSSNNLGRIGPNALIQIPEPSSLMMVLGLSALGLGLWRRTGQPTHRG